MKLTKDEAFKLIDQFTDFLMENIGEPVSVARLPDEFIVQILKTPSKKVLYHGG